MTDTPPETDTLEPIILALSDKRVTLSPELTARIWEHVRLGYAKDPGELIHRVLNQYIETYQAEKR